MPTTSWRPSADVDTLRARAEIFARLRTWFAEHNVMEVHTPVLGGATVTDPDIEALITDDGRFLQTSPEYYMKRMLAAGVPDCYELGPVFRREEQGRLHNAEFTLLEWYRLGCNDIELMHEVGELVDAILGEAPYSTMTYRELVGDAALELPRETLDLQFAEASAGLTGRAFITDYPADQAVLARLRPDDSTFAARFELVIDGVEIANGYWELTEVDAHAERFAQDNIVRRQRGLTEVSVDRQFMEAVAHGLPACAGVALGVDRLVMLALGKSSVGEVLSFLD